MNRRDLLVWLGAGLLPAGAHAVEAPLLTPEERAWVAAHPVILFAPELDFPPFSFVDGQGRHRGLSADVLERVAQATGLRFQPVPAGDLPGNLARARRREVDLLSALRPTTQREGSLAFTSAYVSSPAVVLRRRGDHRPGDLLRMGGERIAVDRDTAFAAFMPEAVTSLQVVEVDTATEAVRQLVFGDADAVVANLATASWIIDRDRLSGLRVAGETGWFTTLALAYRKDWPLLGRVLEKGLAQIPEADRAAMSRAWIPLSELPWWQRADVQRVLGGASITAGAALGGLLLWNRTLRRAVAQRTAALQTELAERQRLETRLRTLAEHDALTGLMNRAALTEALRHALLLARRQKWSVAVIFIDLDKFKAINDTHGHAAGDELLRQISTRLLACLRESDLIGRLGGDEFVVVAQALHDEPRHAVELAEKLLAQVRHPFMIEGESLSMGFSAGIAVFPGHGDSPETLIAHADAAMYRSKERGRFRATLYEAGDAPSTNQADVGETMR